MGIGIIYLISRGRGFMNYKELILNGKSVREFKEKNVEEKYFNEIKDYIENSKKLLPEIDIEFRNGK